jgi:hypothetical protein
MKVLREDPRTFNEALQIAMREQNIRKRFALRQDNEPRQNRYKSKQNNKFHSQDETPMEVDHFRQKRCNKCKRQGNLARDCRVRTANEIHNLSRQGFGGPRQVSNSKNCWKCGQLGHLSKDCQNFKYRQNVHGNYVALSVTRVPERGIIT